MSVAHNFVDKDVAGLPPGTLPDGHYAAKYDEYMHE
jgi:hypothetical protein